MTATAHPSAAAASGTVARETGLRRMLVASDLTASGDRAFDRAVLLAQEHHAAVRFLHVVDLSLLPASCVRRDLREAQARLEHEVQESGVGQKLEVSVKVASGSTDQVVIDDAKAMPADLVVMGLSQDASLAILVRGTTVDRVVRGAPCPVLVVKTRARRAYAAIVVAVDLAEPSRRALELALRLFPAARFTIVHVDDATPADQAADRAPDPAQGERRRLIEDMVGTALKAAGRDGPGAADGTALVFAAGVAAPVLLELATRSRADLVVLGTHGRAGLSGLLLGSVAENLLEVLPQDVLVARG